MQIAAIRSAEAIMECSNIFLCGCGRGDRGRIQMETFVSANGHFFYPFAMALCHQLKPGRFPLRETIRRAINHE